MLRAVTEVFEAAQAGPYVLKVQTLAVALDRADVMVMYMSPAVFATVEGPLREVLASAVTLLRPAAPRADERPSFPAWRSPRAPSTARATATRWPTSPAAPSPRSSPAGRSSVDAMHGAVCDAWLSAGYDLVRPWRRPTRSGDGC